VPTENLDVAMESAADFIHAGIAASLS
jgi:hypothetical protein